MILTQSDIKDIMDLLIKTKKTKDFDYLEEAIEYLREFQDDPIYENDD
jgi:hypothetical protein